MRRAFSPGVVGAAHARQMDASSRRAWRQRARRNRSKRFRCALVAMVKCGCAYGEHEAVLVILNTVANTQGPRVRYDLSKRTGTQSGSRR